jgi:hypothetical protein
MGYITIVIGAVKGATLHFANDAALISSVAFDIVKGLFVLFPA